MERYGKLVGLKLGPYPVVCIYDYELAKEICAKEEASGRPDIFWNNIRMLNKRLGNDIVISNFYIIIILIIFGYFDLSYLIFQAFFSMTTMHIAIREDLFTERCEISVLARHH